MYLSNLNALMKADIRESTWYYGVGVINQIFNPLFPGRDEHFVSEMHFLAIIDC